jgi:hypothetical protein
MSLHVHDITGGDYDRVYGRTFQAVEIGSEEGVVVGDPDLHLFQDNNGRSTKQGP